MPTLTLAELRAPGQRSLFAAGVSVTFPACRPVFDSRFLDVLVPGGSRVKLRLDPGAGLLGFEPGLEAVGAGPLPEVRPARTRYDFADARFHVDVEGLAGLSSISSWSTS